jgi:hypothetical protein
VTVIVTCAASAKLAVWGHAPAGAPPPELELPIAPELLDPPLELFDPPLEPPPVASAAPLLPPPPWSSCELLDPPQPEASAATTAAAATTSRLDDKALLGDPGR